MDRKIHDVYDVILKIIIIVYQEAFLSYIGIDEKIKDLLKTEFVALEGKKYYLDFLCRLEDDTLCHIEFQFPRAKPKDLDRFFYYNIIAEVRYSTLTETIIINFTSKKIIEKIRHIGKSKCFKPKQIYLGDINFNAYWRKINMKVKHNVKLTNFEEITLLLTCLIPECKNKAEILERISKMLKNETLFDENRFEYIQAIIKLEIKKFLPKEEKNKLIGEIDMSPQAEKIITQAINEVNKKSLYEAKQEGIDEGMEKGIEKGIEIVAKNLKDVLSDEEISKRTGFPLRRIKEL